jgi:hypothetical protein
MDSPSFNKFMEYNLDSTKIDTKSILNQNIGVANRESTLPTNSNTLRLLDITDKKLSQNNSSLLKMIQYPTMTNFLSAESDAKQLSNPFKYALNHK